MVPPHEGALLVVFDQVPLRLETLHGLHLLRVALRDIHKYPRHITAELGLVGFKAVKLHLTGGFEARRDYPGGVGLHTALEHKLVDRVVVRVQDIPPVMGDNGSRPYFTNPSDHVLLLLF